MKKLLMIGLIFVVVSAFTLPVSAASTEPGYTREKSSGTEISSVLEGAFTGFRQALSEKKSFFVSMVAVMVVMYLVGALNDAYPSSETVQAVTAVALLSAGLVLYRNVYLSATSAGAAFEQLGGFVTSFAPAMASSLASVGFTQTGVTGCTGLLLAGQICSLISGSAVLPGMNAYLTLGLAASASGNGNLRSISSTVRNAIIIFLAFVLCIYCGVMAVQSSVSVSGDSLSRRTVKFAVGSFVPVFSGAVSEGLDGAFAAGAVMKNSLGIGGIATVVSTIAMPVCGIAADFITLSVCCAVCGFFDRGAFLGYLETARDAYAILFSLSLAIAVMTVTVISMMIRVT